MTGAGGQNCGRDGNTMKLAKMAALGLAGLVLCAAASVPVVAAPAARPQPVRSGGTETLDASGLKFKNLKDLKPLPLPALDCRTATEAATGKTVEVYGGVDYWHHDQVVGEWDGPSGRVLVLEVKYSPESTVPRTVSRESFAEWAKENPLQENPDIATWIKVMTGFETAATAVKFKAEGDVQVTQYGDASEKGCSSLVYVAQSARLKRTLVFVFALNARQVDVEKSRPVVKACVQTIAMYEPKRVEVKQIANPATGGSRKNVSPEYQASRDKVVDGIKNLKGWWVLETEKYIVVSNQQNHQVVETIRRDLEKARSGYEAVYPLLDPMKAVSVIRVFNTRDEYLAYVGSSLKWSGGVWMPEKNELVVSDPSWGDNRSKAESVRSTVFHEGFHQYLHYAVGETHPWFNEGHAQFFEGMEFTGASFRINLLNEEVGEVMKLAAAGKADVRRMFTMSYKTFYGPARNANYALAWGLVYYMNKGAFCSKKTEKYAEIPLRYYLAMLKDGDPGKALAAALEGVDLEQFVKDFNAFWKDARLVRGSASQSFVKERTEMLAKLRKQGALAKAPVPPAT